MATEEILMAGVQAGGLAYVVHQGTGGGFLQRNVYTSIKKSSGDNGGNFLDHY